MNRLKITRILFLIVGVMSLGLMVLWIYLKEPLPAVASAVMAALFLLAGVFFDKYITMGKRHSVNQNIRSITYFFNEENYSAIDSKGTHESGYDALKNICESDTCFAMMVGKRQGFVLNKAGFKTGTPYDFSEFIQNKTGLTMMRPSQ